MSYRSRLHSLLTLKHTLYRIYTYVFIEIMSIFYKIYASILSRRFFRLTRKKFVCIFHSSFFILHLVFFCSFIFTPFAKLNYIFFSLLSFMLSIVMVAILKKVWKFVVSMSARDSSTGLCIISKVDSFRPKIESALFKMKI